jgi:nucleotide-binding universal stress UspA family protein
MMLRHKASSCFELLTSVRFAAAGYVAGMKTILVGYDGTRSAEQALRRASELAHAFGSRVVVVSVAGPDPVPPDGAFGLMPYYDLGAGASAERRTDEELWNRHRAEVQQLFAGAGVDVEFAGVIGFPVEEIVEVAEQQKADLIVVGTREPGWLERIFGGSVSAGVARHARCDVLIVHTPAES